jgi:hypothetical protein
MRPSKLRGIQELEIYQAQVLKLGYSYQTLDEALNLFIWALSKNPREFDPVPGLDNCYVAKTVRFRTSVGIVIPPLRIFFRVEADDNTISLASIRKI